SSPRRHAKRRERRVCPSGHGSVPAGLPRPARAVRDPSVRAGERPSRVLRGRRRAARLRPGAQPMRAGGRARSDQRAGGLGTGGLRPYGLARGPDGAVWLAGGSQIGRLDAGGALTRFSTGGLRADGGITAADGALWFTDPVGARVGRLAPGGHVSSWPTNGYRPART